MIPVPAKNLLWSVFGVALLAALAGPLPELAPVVGLALLGVILFALADLSLSLLRCRLPNVSMANVVRFTKDRPGEISLVFENPAKEERSLRFGLGLPAVFKSENPEQQILLPAGMEQACIRWVATASRRGRFQGVLACCETGSRFGFWRLRRRQALGGELRVYPNLFTERRQLAALFLSRGQMGTKLQRTVGRGREFEKLREYLPGDGYDEIHWKATAKRGRPVTKVFQAERTQEVYVIIDASRLSARPVEHEGVVQTALERYLTTALVLLLAAEQQGDRFGLITYDDRVRTFLRAGGGGGHYAACREVVHALQPGEGTPDLAEIVRHLRTQLRQRALLFFLTDLTDPVLAEDFIRLGGLLGRQHLVMVNQLRAPDVAPLFSTGEVEDAGAIYSRIAGHVRWAEAGVLAKKLKPHGISAALLDNESMAAEVVSQYLLIKQRQIL